MTRQAIQDEFTGLYDPRTRYALRRKAQGLCYRRGKGCQERPEEGKRLCAVCSASMRASNRARYAKMKGGKHETT